MPSERSGGLINSNNLFDIFPDCVRFRIMLGTPFPEIRDQVVSSEIWKGEFPVSFRISSNTRKFNDSSGTGLKMHGIVSMYPSLPSLLKCEVVLDLTLPISGELSRFDPLFGNNLWLHSHTACQAIILGELNRIIDLARANEAPQYMLRNISFFDIEQMTILEVTSGIEHFRSTLFPQFVGRPIKIEQNHIKTRAVVPFYYRNYLDARRHLSEHRHHEMQISASNSIEAGSWFLWHLAISKLSLNPASDSVYMQRYNAVSKAIRSDLNIQNGVPSKAINRVWKSRQMAMHGEQVFMSNEEAASVLGHLNKLITYIEGTASILRAQPLKVQDDS